MAVSAQTQTQIPNKSRLPWGKWLLIAVVVGYITFLILTPLYALVSGAFKQGFGAVIENLIQPEVISSFELTLMICAIVIVVHAVFGTLVAWVMVRQSFPGKKILNSLIDMPFALSPVVVGYMLLLLFGRNGILAPILTAWNIQVVFAIPGMVLATLFVTMPFMVRELIPVMEEFDIRQEQAAATLGASGWQTFWRVTFPALRWGFFYGLTLTFARALGEFGAVLVIGGGISGRTQTATIYIYEALDRRNSIGAYSAALLLGLFSIILVMGSDFLRNRSKKEE